MSQLIKSIYKFLTFYTLKNRTSKYMKQKLIKLQGEIDKSTVLIGDSNTSHSVTNRTCRHKFSKDGDDLTDAE